MIGGGTLCSSRVPRGVVVARGELVVREGEFLGREEPGQLLPAPRRGPGGRALAMFKQDIGKGAR